ncbi:MAG: type II toxin-antitoxin system RelE/ParE family toxin [Micrococcales bacterium]|nr:type II toxin-antitoxin system RelE/ParE family toxin [Micrococcales bacterium]
MTYTIRLTRSAARAIGEQLPVAVAPAVVEFIFGPLAANPHRVGHPLRDELVGHWSARRGEYRVIYRIDDEQVVVLVVYVAHRRDAYRTR